MLDLLIGSTLDFCLHFQDNNDILNNNIEEKIMNKNKYIFVKLTIDNILWKT